MSRLLTSPKRHMKFMQINPTIMWSFPFDIMFWKSLVLVFNSNPLPHRFIFAICLFTRGRWRGGDIWKNFECFALWCHVMSWWLRFICSTKILILHSKLVKHLINFADYFWGKSFSKHLFICIIFLNTLKHIGLKWLKTTEAKMDRNFPPCATVRPRVLIRHRPLF